MVKKEDILPMGNTIFDYFVKNKTYPKSVKIKGEDYSIQQATYLMASFVANPNQKDIKKINVGGASGPTGDRCNRQVVTSTYQNMARKCVEDIQKEKKLPNFVTIDGKQRCSIILFMLQLSKIVKAYKEKNKLPGKILINSNDLKKPEPKPVFKKYGRSTQIGCDNRGQNNGVYCGPHMVQEIIRNLTGKVILQSTLASVIGTTSAGSSHNGINTAFAWFNKTYGYNLKVEWKNFSEVGWNGLKKLLESNNQDAGLHEAYRRRTDFEGYGHYTNFDKIYENSVDVHNSLGDQCSQGCYCGYTENRSKSEAKYYLDGISQKSVLIVTRS